MPEPRNLHRDATRVLSVAMILLGIAITVITLVNAGVAFTNGILLGPLFVAAGLGRLYVLRKGTTR